jgi:MoxR-like ATPase
MEQIDIRLFSTKVEQLKSAMGKVIVGQERAVELLLAAILSRGHVLIEGVPGVAKTLLAKTFSRLINASFSRVQFTPDLMPSDILGTSVFDIKTSEFRLHHGPVFADIVLADEINRAPAKTQAALFEVMEERQATIDGILHRMSPVYTILATQNPIEQEGTYKLPEAQLDRFIMKLTIPYPSSEEELEILERHNSNFRFTQLDYVQPVIDKTELETLINLTSNVYIESSLLKYIVSIIQQTRISKSIYLGASPRASVALLQTSKAVALLHGRDFVTPEDIKSTAPFVLHHRLFLNAEAEMEGQTPLKVVQRLLEKVEVPK